VRIGRFIAFGLCGLILFGTERAIILGLEPGLSIRIAAGFLSLFFFPGVCLAELFFKDDEADFLDRLGSGFVLTLALFSFAGLLAFHYSWRLEKVFGIFFGLGVIAWLAALGKLLVEAPSGSGLFPGVRPYRAGAWIVLALAASSGLLMWFAGASRGPEHDWDLYNYISMVRKFLAWNQASIHHYFYADAPPDPIHSYNLHALVWALIAFENRIDPIQLYIHSAFLTAPLCFLAFFALARRALGASAGFFAFGFYFCFQFIYGGMYFVGNSTFYPDDAIWLLCFPALLSMTFLYIEKRGIRLLIPPALSALAVSIVHPIWGLAFYMTLSFFAAGELLRNSSLFPLAASRKQNVLARSGVLVSAVLFAAPLAMSAVYVAVKALQQPKQWFTPLISGFALDKVWIYFAVFVAAPVAALALSLRWPRLWDRLKASPFYQDGRLRRSLILIVFSLLIAAPYVIFRAEAVANTQWQSFGRNPYRGLITPALFLLNPFKRSFTDPNMTFHPLFWLGLLSAPWLFWLGKSKRSPGALAAFWTMAGVIVLVLNPVTATAFAEFFTLGYLRRILRLAGILAFLPLGALIETILARRKVRAVYAYAACLVVAAGVSLALLPVPAEPLYQGLWKRTINLMRPQNRDTLMTDDTPFRVLRERNLAGPDDVIFSDLYTSFRATAYLDCYVAAQAKPGVGVQDQDQRRLDEIEFFQAETPVARMGEILRKYRADFVIINRDPQYQFYGYQLGHPEAVGKLSQQPEKFEKIFDNPDWVIFRVR